jgi:hypothetical protein
MAEEEYVVFTAETIHRCAERLQADPEYIPEAVTGGMLTCARDPKFVAALTTALNERDVTGQDALVSNRSLNQNLTSFVTEFHQKLEALNPLAVIVPISPTTMRKLKRLVNLKGQKVRYVSARRWEAMGDPRNYVSFWCAAFLAFRGVPVELRFNWDDTSLFVASEMRNGGNRLNRLAWTTEEQLKTMQKLHRSLASQLPGSSGPSCTPRMVQWGFLAAGCGRCHLAVVKIYDRAIAEKDSHDLE